MSRSQAVKTSQSGTSSNAGYRSMQLLFWEAGLERRGESGVMTVTIPHVHAAGRLERPMFGKEDPHRHITLQKIHRCNRKAFLTGFQRVLDASPSQHVTILVHGFNFDFNEAAYRAVQFAHDAKLNETIIVFRWPSVGQPSEDSYFIDVARAMAAVPELAKLIVQIKQATPHAKLSVVAHSLGCRLACHALSSIAASDSSSDSLLIDELILAAPDLDRKAFIAASSRAATRVAKRVTIYVSARDVALQYSSRLHGNRPRLGDASAGVLEVAGIEVLDATRMKSSDLSNHMYFTTNPIVMEDIRAAIHGAPLTYRRARWVNGLETIPNNTVSLAASN